MKTESAVQFDTNARIHIGLEVADRDRSVEFYRLLLAAEPTKVRPGYAKFELADPPLNLSLNQGGSDVAASLPPRLHYGIQVKSREEVHRMAARLRDAGLPAPVENEIACCYATQTKVWATDPDGNPWEVFVVLDNDASSRSDPASACCADEGRDTCRVSGAMDCCEPSAVGSS